MKTAFFTFGQCHRHMFAGHIFDRNVVVSITATEPRDVMFAIFGPAWAFEYGAIPDMTFYPSGVIDLSPTKFAETIVLTKDK